MIKGCMIMRIDMFIHKNDYMVDEIRHRDLIQQSPTLDSDQHKPMDFNIKFVAVWKLLGYWGMRFSGWGFKLQAWAGIYYDRPVIKPSYYRMGMNEDFCCILLEN